MPKESNSLKILPTTLTFNHQKRKRPSNLQLNLHSKRSDLQLNHIAPREQYVKQSFNQSPQTPLPTPEFKENLALMSPNTINKSIANTNQPLYQGQNEKTSLVHFKNQEHRTRSLSYHQGFSQMITALSFLHNSKFTDEEGKDHIGIIHNDIKPEIFYLRKLLKRLFFKRKNYWNI